MGDDEYLSTPVSLQVDLAGEILHESTRFEERHLVTLGTDNRSCDACLNNILCLVKEKNVG